MYIINKAYTHQNAGYHIPCHEQTIHMFDHEGGAIFIAPPKVLSEVKSAKIPFAEEESNLRRLRFGLCRPTKRVKDPSIFLRKFDQIRVGAEGRNQNIRRTFE